MQDKVEITKKMTDLFQEALGEAGLEDAVIMWSAQVKGGKDIIAGSFVTGKRDTVPHKTWYALQQFFISYFGIQQ